MLSRLLGRKPKEPEPGPQLCMPALRSAKGLTDSSITKAWRQLFPGVPIEFSGSGKEGFTIESDGESAILMPMPAPLPAAEIAEAAERSWMWPEAQQQMAGHTAHLIIASPGVGEEGDDPHAACVQSAIVVSRAAAAVCAAGDVAGVYWGNGGHVLRPQFLIECVKDWTSDPENEPMPAPLWVGLVVSKDSREKVTLSSCGMAPMGHREIEIIDTSMRGEELVSFTYDVIAYLLSSGPVLKHGETFGRSEDERFRVEHTTSKFRKGEPVLRFHVP